MRRVLEDEASGDGGGGVDEAERRSVLSERGGAEEGERAGEGFRDYIVGVGREGKVGGDVCNCGDTFDKWIKMEHQKEV